MCVHISHDKFVQRLKGMRVYGFIGAIWQWNKLEDKMFYSISIVLWCVCDIRRCWCSLVLLVFRDEFYRIARLHGCTALIRLTSSVNYNVPRILTESWNFYSSMQTYFQTRPSATVRYSTIDSTEIEPLITRVERYAESPWPIVLVFNYGFYDQFEQNGKKI